MRERKNVTGAENLNIPMSNVDMSRCSILTLDGVARGTGQEEGEGEGSEKD